MAIPCPCLFIVPLHMLWVETYKRRSANHQRANAPIPPNCASVSHTIMLTATAVDTASAMTSRAVQKNSARSAHLTSTDLPSSLSVPSTSLSVIGFLGGFLSLSFARDNDPLMLQHAQFIIENAEPHPRKTITTSNTLARPAPAANPTTRPAMHEGQTLKHNRPIKANRRCRRHGHHMQA